MTPDLTPTSAQSAGPGLGSTGIPDSVQAGATLASAFYVPQLAAFLGHLPQQFHPGWGTGDT